MEYQGEYQEEYQEELHKVHDHDFTHNWVSSSGFLFYPRLPAFLLWY